MRPPASYAQLARQAATLIEQGQVKAAERMLKSVLREQPDNADALAVMGVLCGMRGHLADAVKHLSRAVRRRPDDDSALYNLGQALIRLGRFQEAAEPLERAARLADRPEIHEKLGDALVRLDRLDEAIASYERAVAGDPTNSLALSSLVEAKRKICDWSGLALHEARLVALAQEGGIVEPLLLLYVTDDQALHNANARSYAGQYLDRMLAAARPARPFRYKHSSANRIRLGYLSSDFRNHATSRLVAGMIEAHDRDRFEVIGLAIGPDDGSPLAARMRVAFDRMLNLGALQSAEVARRINAQDIDILIDLNGYIAGSRPEIMAARAAPVQCHYLAFPGTLGGSDIDYMIVDPIIVPAGEDSQFTEALVRLPDCYQANDDKREVAAQRPSRQQCGLPSAALVLCAFNNAIKISPAMFDAWMRILAAVPGSVLWLFEDNRWLAANLRTEAQARGIAAERLVFAKYVAPQDHLARMRCADLFIDTFPYTGHTTASDALWVGLPVLTVAGRSFASRVGASLLTAAGLPELIMPSLEAYEREAIALARAPERLVALRQRLLTQRDICPLFDTARFTRNLEAAYRRMWERHVRGERPAGFSVQL